MRAALPAADADPAAGAGPRRPAEARPDRRARYRIRCVYRRPRCAPLAGRTSSASRRSSSRIARFFDPDAPARDIRIPLPVDTGLKDLRKYRKNVGFMISNQLRGQMNRITDLKKALDGEIAGSQRWDLGMICQFSIPIITICALILLMIFVVLLNIVFCWLPFFRICLPVPAEVGADGRPGACSAAASPSRRGSGADGRRGVVRGRGERPRVDPVILTPSRASGCGCPAFGGGLRRFLFEPNTTTTRARLADRIRAGRRGVGAAGAVLEVVEVDAGPDATRSRRRGDHRLPARRHARRASA